MIITGKVSGEDATFDPLHKEQDLRHEYVSLVEGEHKVTKSQCHKVLCIGIIDQMGKFSDLLA